MRVAVLLLLLASAGALAQPATEARPSWLGLGVGASTGRDGRSLLGLGVDVLAPVGPVVLQGGASMAETARGLLERPSEKAFEGHLTAGVAGRRGPLHAAVTFGPSLSYATLFRNDERTRGATGIIERARFSPGAYASVLGIVALSPGFGIRAEAFGLANADLPTAGLRLGVVVGNL